jgi:SAM-dependent methyltransferase
MKKDYIATNLYDENKGETSFVESYWTKVWEQRKLSANIDKEVEDNEVYPIINKYIAGLPNKSRLLDGGCGMGEWVDYYTRRGKEVIGLDLSKDTVIRLKKHYNNCQFQHGDIRNTGFSDNSFDAMFSWGTFEHFEVGLGECFQEAARILKPGGLLFVSVPYQNLRHIIRDRKVKNKDWNEVIDTNDPTKTITFYQWRLTETELAAEFLINGFNVKEILPIAKRTGVKRLLQHSFLKITPEHRLFKLLFKSVLPIIPAHYVSHMIVGVGVKQ